MNWLLLVLITVVFDSSRIFIDNYISDYYFKSHGAVSQKFFYGYAFVIFSIILLIITGIDFSYPTALLLFIASGILTSFAGPTYYSHHQKAQSQNQNQSRLLCIFICPYRRHRQPYLCQTKRHRRRFKLFHRDGLPLSWQRYR